MDMHWMYSVYETWLQRRWQAPVCLRNNLGWTEGHDSQGCGLRKRRPVHIKWLGHGEYHIPQQEPQ